MMERFGVGGRMNVRMGVDVVVWIMVVNGAVV